MKDRNWEEKKIRKNEELGDCGIKVKELESNKLHSNINDQNHQNISDPMQRQQ